MDLAVHDIAAHVGCSGHESKCRNRENQEDRENQYEAEAKQQVETAAKQPYAQAAPPRVSVPGSSYGHVFLSEDGGLTWSAVRGAPGGDDYQRIWINPTDTQIVLVVADQGAVVSANRGRSWSNWYNQNTAAMYHVTTDNAFPYRVCSGQQDSGSACVQSRSDDGRITFHDWHPVNIQ